MGEWDSAKGGEVFAGPAIDRYPGRKEEQELPILVWEVPGFLPHPLSLPSFSSRDWGTNTSWTSLTPLLRFHFEQFPFNGE